MLCSESVSPNRLLLFYFCYENIMKNALQRFVYSLITVIITVAAFIFYRVYVVEGQTWAEISTQWGLYMFWTILPIRAVFLIEAVCALTLAILYGPVAFRLTRGVFDPNKNHPMLFESAIICSTVCLMCPSMSLLAVFFYYPYTDWFSILQVLATWFKLVCYNLPFAYFSQMFFVQPFMRRIINVIFPKNVEERKNAHKEEKWNTRPQDEIDAIADVLKRMDELEKELAHEKQLRKAFGGNN